MLNHEVILPTYQKPVPNIAIVIDTSGSVNDKALQQAFNEAEGICRVVKGTVTVVDVDSAARSTKTKSMKRVKAEGGGGTDMRVGIAKAMSDKRNLPNLVCVISDGYTPWPTEDERPRNAKLLIVLVGKHVTKSGIPSWASVVTVDVDDE